MIDKFFEFMLEGLFKFLMIFCVFGIMWLCFFLIPQDFERTDKAKDIAQEMGCQYIGSARDLNSIKFLDCAGTIKMIRVK